jgi:segregation and condensation protein A
MDLLLYLIKKEEMDILDIQINKITKQYLDYLKAMKDLDLEIASEFIDMASTLILIKSKMLLPQYDESGELVETEDPRKELARRLMEYQKFKDISAELNKRPLKGRDWWVRGCEEELPQPEEEIIVEENGLFSLISFYRSLMKSVKSKVHRVAAKAQSIAQRVLEIKDQMITGMRITMSSLVTNTGERRPQTLITFLSLLELAKMGFVSLFQNQNYEEIYIDTLKPIETDVINRVEEYDAISAEQTALKIFGNEEDSDGDSESKPAEVVTADGDSATGSVEDGSQANLEADIVSFETSADSAILIESNQSTVSEIEAELSLFDPQVIEESLQTSEPVLQVTAEISEVVIVADEQGSEQILEAAIDSEIVESKLSPEVIAVFESEQGIDVDKSGLDDEGPEGSSTIEGSV